MQRTQVRSLVREDPICCRATKPAHHNYQTSVLEPGNSNYWAHLPQLLKPSRPEPVLRNKRRYHSEKPAHCNQRVAPACCNKRKPAHSNKNSAQPKIKINDFLKYAQKMKSQELKFFTWRTANKPWTVIWMMYENSRLDQIVSKNPSTSIYCHSRRKSYTLVFYTYVHTYKIQVTRHIFPHVEEKTRF